MPYARRAPSPYEIRTAAPWLRATATACEIELDELLQHNWRDARMSIIRAVVVVLIQDARLMPAQVARLLQRDNSTITHHERAAADDRLAQEFMAAIRAQHALSATSRQRGAGYWPHRRRGGIRRDEAPTDAGPALEVVTREGRPALTVLRGGAA